MQCLKPNVGDAEPKGPFNEKSGRLGESMGGIMATRGARSVVNKAEDSKTMQLTLVLQQTSLL